MALPAISIQVVLYDDKSVATIVQRTWDGRRKWDRFAGTVELSVTNEAIRSSSVNAIVREALTELLTKLED